MSNHPVCLLRRSTKDVLFGCESTNVRSVRLVNSCVPVSVERLDQDKDADENVDADQIRTGRLVESGQSIGLLTQREEIDIHFRVSGLPHAVVNQAENFSVRELVKKIENHPHREALQADLQQNNVYNPFSGRIESNDSSECLLCWNQGIVYCTCGHLLVESESSHIFHPWRLDAFSIPHLVIKKGRPHGARHGKTDAQKKHFMAPTRRSASRWINWHRKTTPTAHPLRSMRDIRKNWYISLNKSDRNAPMKTPIRLPNSSHYYEPSPPRIWRRTT